MQESSASIPSPQTDRDGWLRWRMNRIQASDVAVLFGESPFHDDQGLFREKCHKIPMFDADLGKLAWRLRMEEMVAERYAAETGRKLRRQPPRVHPEHDFLGCTVDRQILNDPKGPGMLQIKTASDQWFRKIRLDGYPPSVLLQTTTETMCWGYSWGAICIARVSDGRLIHFDFNFDEELAEEIIRRAREFMALVENGTPPTRPAQVVKLPQIGGELTRMNNPEWAEAVAGFNEARQILSEAEALKGASANKLQSIMLAAEADVAEGAGLRVYWREQAGRKSLDKSALLAAHPEIDLSQFTKTGQPFKSFRPYQVGGDGNV